MYPKACQADVRRVVVSPCYENSTFAYVGLILATKEWLGRLDVLIWVRHGKAMAVTIESLMDPVRELVPMQLPT